MVGLLSRRPNVNPASPAPEALSEVAEVPSMEWLGLSSGRYLPACGQDGEPLMFVKHSPMHACCEGSVSHQLLPHTGLTSPLQH